jgi:hypothetical protein
VRLTPIGYKPSFIDLHGVCLVGSRRE